MFYTFHVRKIIICTCLLKVQVSLTLIAFTLRKRELDKYALLFIYIPKVIIRYAPFEQQTSVGAFSVCSSGRILCCVLYVGSSSLRWGPEIIEMYRLVLCSSTHRCRCVCCCRCLLVMVFVGDGVCWWLCLLATIFNILARWRRCYILRLICYSASKVLK